MTRQLQVASPTPFCDRRCVARASLSAGKKNCKQNIHQPQQPEHAIFTAQASSFRDQRHRQYYQPVVAGKPKLQKRIKQQQKRLKELARAVPVEPTAATMHALLTEMRDLTESLGAVSKVTKYSVVTHFLPSTSFCHSHAPITLLMLLLESCQSRSLLQYEAHCSLHQHLAQL